MPNLLPEFSPPSTLRGALMVCGTTSDAGKSTVVAGLCRLLARQGVKVAPFKAQNMANNSMVTQSGHEIGRAQAFQAFAAGVPAEVAMNPVLLKPMGQQTCQVVLNGRPWRTMSAAQYHDSKLSLMPQVLDALQDLRTRFDVVLCEGAGSPAEINLLDRDITNLRVAHEAGIGALLVGDINPGGVFAALYGTVALLPDHLRACIRGLVINKLRGDPSLLLDGSAQLFRRTGVPLHGVIPWISATGLEAEDSMALDHAPKDPGPPIADGLDIAVIGLPCISNFTDFDALTVEPGAAVRYVRTAASLGQPDLIIIPGSKSTVSDLTWLRSTGLDRSINNSDAVVLGICGGYQMLGTHIIDNHAIESDCVSTPGLGRLGVTTEFAAVKLTEMWTGQDDVGEVVDGYLIHHGRVHLGSASPWLTRSAVGSQADNQGAFSGTVYGTTLHGLFDADPFRRSFLSKVAEVRGKRFISAQNSFFQARVSAVDTIADVLEEHLDMAAIEQIIASSALVA